MHSFDFARSTESQYSTKSSVDFDKLSKYSETQYSTDFNAPSATTSTAPQQVGSPELFNEDSMDENEDPFMFHTGDTEEPVSESQVNTQQQYTKPLAKVSQPKKRSKSPTDGDVEPPKKKLKKSPVLTAETDSNSEGELELDSQGHLLVDVDEESEESSTPKDQIVVGGHALRTTPTRKKSVSRRATSSSSSESEEQEQVSRKRLKKTPKKKTPVTLDSESEEEEQPRTRLSRLTPNKKNESSSQESEEEDEDEEQTWKSRRKIIISDDEEEEPAPTPVVDKKEQTRLRKERLEQLQKSEESKRERLYGKKSKPRQKFDFEDSYEDSFDIDAVDSQEAEIVQKKKKKSTGPRSKFCVGAYDREAADDEEGEEEMDDFIVADDAILTQYSQQENEEMEKIDRKSKRVDEFEEEDDEEIPQQFRQKPSMFEAYQRYIQFIALSILDPKTDFREDDYFPESIRMIEDNILQRKDSLISSSAWKDEYRKALEGLPRFREDQEGTKSVTCQACNRTNHPATSTVRLFGRYYDSSALNTFGAAKIEFDSEQKKEKYYLGSTCCRKTHLWHSFHHFKFHLIQKLTKELTPWMDGKNRKELREAKYDIVNEYMNDHFDAEKRYAKLQEMLEFAEEFSNCAKKERGAIDVSYALVSDEESDDDTNDRVARKEKQQKVKAYTSRKGGNKRSSIGRLETFVVAKEDGESPKFKDRKITEWTKGSRKRPALETEQVTIDLENEDAKSPEPAIRLGEESPKSPDSMDTYFERANEILYGKTASVEVQSGAATEATKDILDEDIFALN
jgi:hypothetical protein